MSDETVMLSGFQAKGAARSVSIQDYDEAVRRFDAKMEAENARAIYKRPAPLIEFPNAWIKSKFKLRSFSTRGLAEVQCEAYWTCHAISSAGSHYAMGRPCYIDLTKLEPRVGLEPTACCLRNSCSTN